ncbi:MAG TPA: Gfo/Idh/MocA family oxidoreductase [Tepidisphaeraceae bacterium]|jgi:predicted dehydrogenase|nr:Gfo/Idh/MocA family oxidoreductase [Tepidisphaeraceae bacterium]
MPKQWRSAVVGVGTVGSWHCRILAKMENNTLVATCDKDSEKAKQTLTKIGMESLPIYSDVKEMLTKEQIDVVHVCTPSGDHMTPAIAAMEMGKNVICEKPVEIQLDRIDKMIAAAKKNNVKLAGIFQNRWNLANAALKHAADENRYGRVSFAGCYTPWFRTDEYYREGGWRGTWKLDGGGAIMNQSVHAVDLLQWIAGPIKSVSAYAGARIHKEIEVEDTLACSLQFESGAFGVIVGTTAMYPGSSVRIEIGGENGTAITEYGQGLRTYKFREPKPDDEATIKSCAPSAGPSGGASSNVDVALDLHFRNITHILESWERGEDASTDGVEARKAVAIIVAMYESAKNGGQAVAVK